MRLIALSALQHYVFCPRQCALIHNEQEWAENFLTAQGQVLHQRVDSGVPETRKGIRYERSVHLASHKLGLVGVADVVEVENKTGLMRPVEYKRGRSKLDNVDKVQLCAQAICLEEMCGIDINEGVLWYQQTKRRELVALDKNLREETLAVIQKVRHLLDTNITPKPIYQKACKACSLIDICQPKLIEKDNSVDYINQILGEEQDEEAAK